MACENLHMLCASLIFNVVLFPAPFGPKKAKISPSFTEKEVLSTALKP